MKQMRRERNPQRPHAGVPPLNAEEEFEGVNYDRTLTGPEWGTRHGNPAGYDRRFGQYGSAARGWVDQPHDRDEDLEDKILREKYLEEEPSEREEGLHRGKGPKNYLRSDQDLLDEVCDRITRDENIDGTDIEVSVEKGEVFLSGSVPDRLMKYWAEDVAEEVVGADKVVNQIKVKKG